MSTPVFIGVGGTGQTVLAAYLRLATMAGFTPAPFYVVDSDTEGPLGGGLTNLRARISHVVGGSEPPLRWVIDPFPTHDADRKTFAALFNNLAGDRRELFNCLFSQEAEQTRIRTGMYGRPAVGATCIRYKFLQEDDDLLELKNSLRGGSKHVILVGSCFGGTGSGGVPMLAAEFSKLNSEPGYDLRVDAVVFLPWFRLTLPEGGINEGERILHDHLNQNFEPNAAAGINYFKDQLKRHTESIFLFGVQDPSQIKRESSESLQREEPHALNLLAAILIQNHFVEALKPPRGIVGYWYDPEVGLNPNGLSIHRESGNEPISLRQVIHRASMRRQWLGILSTFFKNFKKIPKVYRPIFLTVAVEKLAGTTDNPDQVTDRVATELLKAQRVAEDSIRWIQSMRDDAFFPLEEGAEVVQSDLYGEIAYDPLSAISEWCDDKQIVAKFNREDLKAKEVFTEKFADLFINHLTDKLQLA